MLVLGFYNEILIVIMICIGYKGRCILFNFRGLMFKVGWDMWRG